MWIFGRKANQQPATPDVPPELQPYYSRPTLRTRVKRAGLFILPVIAALALVAALIGGGLWLRSRMNESSHTVATNQQARQAPGQSNQQDNNNSASNTQGNQTQSQASQPPAASGSSGNQPADGTSQAPDTSAQAATNIPNTGPSTDMYLAAALLAIAATTASYIRQLKLARR